MFAWTSAVGALVVLAMGYTGLPDQIPLTRWTTGSKTLLLVLRVPIINLLCLVLVHILESALVRAHGHTALRDNAMKVTAILFAMVGFKSFLEAVELLVLPRALPWILPSLLLIIFAGFIGIVWTARRAAMRWNSLWAVEFRGMEKSTAIFCVFAILAFQFIPLL